MRPTGWRAPGTPSIRRLVESIRGDRPAGADPGAADTPRGRERYQVAYGHRRREAAAELGVAVKAIVRAMSDTELVVAQGKENAERRNLSFIERALFAAHLESRGFDRATLNAALGVHTAEMTRLLAVAAAVPAGDHPRDRTGAEGRTAALDGVGRLSGAAGGAGDG